MNAELIRALTPPFLAACGVAIFAIATGSNLTDGKFAQVSNIVSACLGGAAGASMSNGSRGNISAKEIENVDMGSADRP